MAPEKLQSSAWALGREQHGVVTRAQLIDLGYGSEAIRHRVRKGRIHPVQPGVYAIGRPELSQLGSWLAAVLSCGSRAVLSHESAAALWGLRRATGSSLSEVSVPKRVVRRRTRIVVHRRSGLGPEDAAIDRPYR